MEMVEDDGRGDRRFDFERLVRIGFLSQGISIALGTLSHSLFSRLIARYNHRIFVENERARFPRPYAVSIRLIRQWLMGEVTSNLTVGVGNRNSLLQGSLQEVATWRRSLSRSLFSRLISYRRWWPGDLLSRLFFTPLIPPYKLLILVENERTREPRPYAVSIRLIRQWLMGEVTSNLTVGVGNRNSLLQGSPQEVATGRSLLQHERRNGHNVQR